MDKTIDQMVRQKLPNNKKIRKYLVKAFSDALEKSAKNYPFVIIQFKVEGEETPKHLLDQKA